MKRRLSNPLALAVLSQLVERPMHPYQIAAQMRFRGVDQSIKLNYGSLYSVVELLVKEGLIVAQGVERQGDLPARTIYAVTDEGRTALMEWLRDLISTPVKEYTQFAAGLTFIGHLSPSEVRTLLQTRARLLSEEIRDKNATLETLMQQGLNRLFLIEEEHAIVLREAELAWVQQLIRQLDDGTFTEMVDGQVVWRINLELATMNLDTEGPELEPHGRHKGQAREGIKKAKRE